MPIFDNDTKKKLEEVFEELKNNVNVVFFTQEFECDTCKDTRTFLEEISKCVRLGKSLLSVSDRFLEY